MQVSHSASFVRVGALALVIAGVLFVAYPAVRPFSDEAGLEGARAFASGQWVTAHVMAIFAFTLLALGLAAAREQMSSSAADGAPTWAMVLGWLGVGLILPFYGAETFGLRVIGREALSQGSTGIMNLAAEVRSGTGLYLFAVGLMLLAAAAVLLAAAIWRSGLRSRWSGLPLALGLLMYIPQYMWEQPLRVAHGALMTIGCISLAFAIWPRER